MKKTLPCLLLLLAIILSTSCSHDPNSGNGNNNTNPADSSKNRLVYSACDNGNLYAFNASDGSVKWSNPLFSNAAQQNFIHSSPTVMNGVLYIGAPPSNVVAVNAETGATIWTYTMDLFTAFHYNVYSSPIVSGGVVYIGGGGKVYAINAVDGTLRWEYTIPNPGLTNQFDTSPTVANGKLFFNCEDDPLEGLFVFDANDGTLLQTLLPNLEYSGSVSPCIAGNNVIWLVRNNTGSQGRIVKYDINTYHAWAISIPIDDPGLSSPTVDGSTCFIGGGNNLYAFDNSSSSPYDEYKWVFTAGGNVSNSSPSVNGDHVYIGCFDAILYSIKASTGAMEWETHLDNSGSVRASSSPTIANGVIYYGTNTSMVAVNATTGAIIWRTAQLGDFHSSACVISKTGEIFHSGISGVHN